MSHKCTEAPQVEVDKPVAEFDLRCVCFDSQGYTVWCRTF